MTEHIDGDRLYDDLHYRFEYLSKFLNFTEEDIQSLNLLATVVLPRIPVIVDAVYRKLFQFDLTKNFFVLRNDGFVGRLPKTECLALDSPQMTYRRDMLSGYLKRVLLQREWTDDFLQYLSRVGRMHTNKYGSSSINVDYIHINSTLSYIETLLIENLWTMDAIEHQVKKTVVIALNKVFRIQSDFFLLHYFETSEEPTDPSEDEKPHNKCTCS